MIISGYFRPKKSWKTSFFGIFGELSVATVFSKICFFKEKLNILRSIRYSVVYPGNKYTITEWFLTIFARRTHKKAMLPAFLAKYQSKNYFQNIFSTHFIVENAEIMAISVNFLEENSQKSSNNVEFIISSCRNHRTLLKTPNFRQNSRF